MTRRASLTLCFVSALAGCDEERLTFRDAPFADAADDVTPTAPGSPCGVNEQGEPIGGCSAGQFCVSPREGFPNGYCAPDCRRAPCPTGSVCFPSSATQHFCLRGCTRDGDCRVGEGYACRVWNPGAFPGCLPNDAPVGRRADGRACFATDGDAGVGPFLAPLPARAFATVSTSVTRDRFDTLGEAEVSLALLPTGGALVAFMGYDARGFWRGGVALMGSDGVVTSLTRLRDMDFPDILQPSLATDRAGRPHVVYVARDPDIPGDALRHARSDDGGRSFEAARQVVTPVRCGLGCNAPAIAIGQTGGRDFVYAATITGQRDGSTALLVTRAPTDGGSFEEPFTLAALEVTAQHRRAPAVAALTAGSSGGVMAAWVARNVDNALSRLGDVVNRVRVRRSRDGGQTWGAVEEVTREGDAPVEQTPWMVAGGGVTHVVYVTGGVLGAWDVVLATRRDGDDSWRHRVVNDDPERCATHAFAGLALDPGTGDAHVVWLDNRYGGAIAAYARCPADPATRCGRNELVSGESFLLATSRDPTRWHGTRSACALSPDGALWAAWSDARTGGPGVYVSRGRP